MQCRDARWPRDWAEWRDDNWTAYEKALELDPMLVKAYSGKGRALTMLGNYVNALQILTKAIEMDPNDGMAFFYRGLTHYRSYNLKKACEDLTIAVELGIAAARKDKTEICKELEGMR